MSVFGPLQHFNYPVLDVECTCGLCVYWRTQRDAFDGMKRLTFDHNRSCMCWRCIRRRQLQQSFLASAAKRELYCEFSWHAAKSTAHGVQLMTWVGRELKSDQETDGWWSTFAQAYSLAYWLARFHSAVVSVSAAVSGAVARKRQVLSEADIATYTMHVNGAIPPVMQQQTWCGWCGDDLPEQRVAFCTDDCRADYVANEAVVNRTKPRLRLSDFVSVYGGSGDALAVSGVAA